MQSITITTRVGPDGVLRVQLPLEFANSEVSITINFLPTDNDTIEEHRKIVDEIAGSWLGDFERPPERPTPDRDPF